MVNRLLCVFLLALMGALPAQTVQREELASGLTLVVAEHHTSATVAVQVFVRAGPAHEGQWLNHGISATLGRVLLAAAPESVRQQVDGAGREFTVHTTPTYTRYSVLTTQIQAPQVIDALARLMHWQGYTPKDLAIVQEQMLLEERQRLDDPDTIARQSLDRLLYHDHAARWPVAGDAQLRQGLTVSELREYQQSHYTAPNMIVVVAGNVYSEAVESLVRRSSSELPRSGYQRRQAAHIAPSGGNRSVFRQVPGLGERRSVIAWSTVPLGHQDQFALKTLASYLNGPLSPLRAALESKQLADHIEVRHHAAIGRPGSLEISYRVRGDQGPAALAAINQVLRDLKEGSLDPVDLEASQRHLRLRLAGDMLDMRSLAEGVGRWELSIGRPQGFIAHTREDVGKPGVIGEIARRYLVVDRFHRVSLSDESAEQPPHVERIGPESLDTVLPEVDGFDNGVRLVRRSLPIGLVAVRLTMGAGPAVEDSANVGASALLAELFRSGTDDVDFRTDLQRQGMDYEVDLGIDHLAVGITCLPDQVPDAIRRLKELVATPIVDPDRFAIAQQRLLGRIASQQVAQGWQARLHRMINERLLSDHFAGQPLLGVRETVERFDPAAIDAFLARLRSGSNILLSLYGEWDEASAIPAVHRHFANGTAFRAEPFPRQGGQGWPKEIAQRNVTIVDEQTQAQAMALVFRGIAADAALQRRAAGDVLHEILSGQHGTGRWLYSRMLAGAQDPLQVAILDRRFPGRGYISLAVQMPDEITDPDFWRERIGEAVDDLQRALAQTGGAQSAPSLQAAQAACLLSREQMGQDQQAIAAYHAGLLLREGGLQAVRDYDAAVRAVTAADLLALLELGFEDPILQVSLVRSHDRNDTAGETVEVGTEPERQGDPDGDAGADGDDPPGEKSADLPGQRRPLADTASGNAGAAGG